MLDDPFKYGLLVALAIALLCAAFTDLRSRKIANWLTAGIALAAPLFWWANGLGLWPDVALQLGVALGTFAVLAGLFAIGAMGGGDVKLFSGLGALAGPLAGIELQWLAYNVLVVLALGTLARRGELVPVLKRSWRLLRGGSCGESTPSEPLTTFRLGAPIFVAAVIQLALTRAP